MPQLTGFEMRPQRRDSFAFSLKRVIDIVAAAGSLVVLAPVLAATAVAIRLTMGRPVLFRQVRPGLGEQSFTLLKFRTMLPEVAPDGRARTELERVTPSGWFLRRTSLDELPQLWNVLKGDLSLVGPRPLMVKYLPYYSERERLRHTMRPGITGLAQVTGRHLQSWDERLELDARYAENWSLWLDLRILIWTAARLLRPTDVVRDPMHCGSLDELRQAQRPAPTAGR